MAMDFANGSERQEGVWSPWPTSRIRTLGLRFLHGFCTGDRRKAVRWPLCCCVQSVACAPALGSQESRPAGPLCSLPAGAEPRQGSGNVSGALKAGGLVSRSQPQTWVPQPGQLAGRLRGSRSEERILNHIYMCMKQKGKGRGEGTLRIRNPKRKSLTNPPERERENQPQICVSCSQIAVPKSSASRPPPSFPGSNLPKQASNLPLICALVVRTKQDVTAAPSTPPRPCTAALPQRPETVLPAPSFPALCQSGPRITRPHSALRGGT